MAQFGYFDESGNFGFAFRKPSVSTHFTVCGIIFSEDALTKVEALAESLAQSFFNGSEIKSSNVGNDDARRLDILKAALREDYHVYAMIFDKRKMFGKGLRYKRSFLKFTNRLAYENLALSFDQIVLVADEHGSKEFMNGFRAYIEARFARRDLFGKTEFGFEASKSNRLVQLADFFAGSIARCYDRSMLSPRRREIMSLLHRSRQLLPVFEWPARTKPYSEMSGEALANRHDNSVLRLSIKRAQKFVYDNPTNRDEFVPIQVATIRVLLQNIQYGDRVAFLPTDAIIDYFSVNSKLVISKKQFGRCVIGPLRDAGVLVASNTTGYKLVANVEDLNSFVEYFHHFLHPMLDRVSRYRKIVLLATKNNLDILKAKQYSYLRKYYKAVRDN